MRVVRSLTVLSLVSAALLASACGGDDPSTSSTAMPGLGSAQNGAASGGSTAGTGAVVPVPGAPVNTTPVPVGGGGSTGGVTTVGPSLCSTQVIDAYGSTPDMLIVLDRSLSMQLENRWEPSKNAVKTITTEFERLLSFGLVMFPGGGGIDPLQLLLGGGACAGGEKLDVPLKALNAAAINQAVSATMPMGLTPTGAGLGVALKVLGDRRPQLDAQVKPGFVLLVTDGEPLCDVLMSPDTAQQDAALMAVKALKDANIPTYVIGYQIAPMWQGVMNQLAMSGGTNMYHPAESGDQIVQIFREITKDVVKCSFELSMVPPNPKFVRVTIDKKTVSLDAADGWVLNGKTVTLQGGSCATLKDGKGHNVGAQIECNEVLIN